MPDITMCKGYEMTEGNLTDGGKMRVCPNAERCWRYTAEPSQRQSYFVGLPTADPARECGYLIPWSPPALITPLASTTGSGEEGEG